MHLAYREWKITNSLYDAIHPYIYKNLQDLNRDIDKKGNQIKEMESNYLTINTGKRRW